MKRFISLVFALFALICMLAVTGCSVSWTEEEIKKAKSVEITCYDNHGSSDAVEIYTITDEKEVNSICNTFSLLVVKKAKITEPIFIVLKLLGVIKWSWIWVLSPLWISAVIVIVVFSVILIGGRIKKGKW